MSLEGNFKCKSKDYETRFTLLLKQDARKHLVFSQSGMILFCKF